MTFDPTTNRIQWQHLTDEEREALKAWQHGWEYWSDLSEEWVPEGKVFNWLDDTVYRANPAPEVKSAWHNVFASSCGGFPYAQSWHLNLEQAKSDAGDSCIGIIRLDLIDGKLSVEVEQ